MAIDKILKVEDLSTLSTDTLIVAYKNGYKVEETIPNLNITNIKGDSMSIDWEPLTNEEIEQLKNPIKTKSLLTNGLNIFSLATCPASVVQGSQHQITAQASGGTPPYTFTMYRDGIQTKDTNGNPWTYTTSSTSPFSFYATFNQPLGSHTLTLRVIDSCTSPSPQVTEDSCTINITCPTLNTPTITLPASVVQGSAFTPTVSWTGGISPYRVWLYEGTSNLIYDSGTPVNLTGNSSSPSVSTSGWSTGSHTLWAEVRDSCPSTIQYAQSANYSISVTAPSCPSISSCSITCPSGNIAQESSAIFTSNWVGGTPNYNIVFYKDSDTTPFATTTSSTTTSSINTTMSNTYGWGLGTHTIYSIVTDSCSTPQTCKSLTCTINVTASCSPLSVNLSVAP